jgi:hypothetical protein
MKIAFLGFVSLTLTACVSSPKGHDYTEFRKSNPSSVLILPPINNSSEVIAPYSLMSQLTVPIAESGFYVFPPSLIEKTFVNNGLTVAQDIHAVPLAKLYSIFGADTALYLTIDEYGTSYVVLSSETAVTASAQLVDLRNGKLIWAGRARASSAESRGNNGGGIAGMLIQAALTQIIETVSDTGFDVSAIAAARLTSAESFNGFMYGPRSPKFGEPVPSEKK